MAALVAWARHRRGRSRTPAGLGSELVDQGRHKPLKRTRSWRPEQRAQPLGDPGLCLIQRSDHVAPEPGRVVVAGIQAQPRHRPPATAGPVGQQRRFAESRRSADQHSSPRQPLAERLHQARARRKARLRPRNVQLGRQQDILPGHGSPAWGRRRRVSHRGPTAQPASEPRSGRWTGPFYGLTLPTGGPEWSAHHRKIPPACHLRVTPRPASAPNVPGRRQHTSGGRTGTAALRAARCATGHAGPRPHPCLPALAGKPPRRTR